MYIVVEFNAINHLGSICLARKNRRRMCRYAIEGADAPVQSQPPNRCVGVLAAWASKGGSE